MALARAAERGGVTSVQLRLKQVPARQIVQIARELISTLNVPILVNDRPDVAIAAGAAGLTWVRKTCRWSLSGGLLLQDF